jgi:hypothetical protein
MIELDPDDKSEGSETNDIKVTDRRHFTREGVLRDEAAASEAEEDRSAGDAPTGEAGGAEEVRAPREDRRQTSGAGFERRPIEEPEGVDFTMLINAMAQPALVFLGEVPHPGTGKPEVNLEQARLQIDLLDMLRIKCRGNMTPEEEGLLDRMLYQLRMLFVTRSGPPGSQTGPSS